MSPRNYEVEEKLEYLEKYHESKQSINAFSRENDIPPSTLNAWIKEEQEGMFGVIDLNTEKPKVAKEIKKSMIFANDSIRLELKEGYSKQLLKKITEVLLNVE